MGNWGNFFVFPFEFLFSRCLSCVVIFA